MGEADTGYDALVERAVGALRAGRVDELVDAARTLAARCRGRSSAELVRAGSLLQSAYRFTGDGPLRREGLELLRSVADRVDEAEHAVRARALMGTIHMMHGALHRALEHFDAALALAAATGLDDHPATAMGHQFRGYVLFEWNRLDDAAAALEAAWERAGSPGRGVRSGVARMAARVEAARGDEAGVDRWLERLEEVVTEPLTLRNREWLAATRAGLTLGRGDLRAVEAWLRRWDYRPEAFAATTHREIRARLHELDQALTLLEATAQWAPVLAIAPRVREASGDERRWFAARAATAEAVAHEAKGRRAEAGEALADALALGEVGAFVRAYVEGHRLRGVLLRRLAADGHPGARRVLEAAPELGRDTAPVLTPTQTAVLERVAAGGSNRAVAREMGVTVSTVKTHLRAVFSRLEVASRTQAVARARELGLLGDP